ncbi:hypothetical protein GT755_12650 [Herbidospora sp. NEAU-GS84]|uniref:Uncharacterized protein n=1 Tax=Herbidospora solisilvae TaxID=2696284 RepID=A0A7C9NHC5_9ACTN|nr:hypothetical protein [Herbidospora solisilvae]
MFQGNLKFIGYAPGNGSTLIRDPRTVPTWHSLGTVQNYPGNVTGVSLARMGRDVHVTVVTATGQIWQTACRVRPTPGTGMNPAWPGNCSPFVNHTPPNG